MAKWTFEDYANGAMAVVGIALVANQMYQEHKRVGRIEDRNVAQRWSDEAAARLNSMAKHMRKERASKECWVEAFTAAKNVLAFEVRETLTPNNFHMLNAQKEIFQRVDQLIAEAK